MRRATRYLRSGGATGADGAAVSPADAGAFVELALMPGPLSHRGTDAGGWRGSTAVRERTETAALPFLIVTGFPRRATPTRGAARNGSDGDDDPR
jgi:hypothetical protein